MCVHMNTILGIYGSYHPIIVEFSFAAISLPYLPMPTARSQQRHMFISIPAPIPLPIPILIFISMFIPPLAFLQTRRYYHNTQNTYIR